MPVHFKVAPHDANKRKKFRSLETTDNLLAATWGWEQRRTRGTSKCAELLQTSYRDVLDVVAKANGFVDTVTEAYNMHYHLIIRPDDVWMAILSQLNFYVNAHAEELRHKFVEHEGKKKLTIEEVGTRYSVDFGALAVRMTRLIDENVVDKELKDWILPDFTTTTVNDTVVCAVYMMSTLKAYFSYKICLQCGIPSVTLEGEKSDWERLLLRIDKLKDFGPEPEIWASLLHPILSRFVTAFDGNPDVEFWNRVCHYKSHGSGETVLTGWITAFCVWDSRGVWMGPPLTGSELRYRSPGEILVLDGVQYGAVGAYNLPSGFCDVDVLLNDNGKEFDCMMVSGHLALKTEGEDRDTVRPHPGWLMFIKEDGVSTK
ncbi:hypothetical protein BDN70DRAFT_849120 [Pholiota conissans]|uniref:Uncharacterized protein n=1 Tax=Pholiota conissans TaxID=109636 RepID=A0A9P6D5R8_9AGAR|nr:hypothetical protein BDN70DRAFT_849120 [Pholiota conissans]